MAKNWLLRLFRSIVLFALLIGGGLAIFKQQEIVDWWRLRDYSPSANVSELAKETTMTDFSKRVFYSNDPQVQDKMQFYVSCEENETIVVLGCYKPKTGIYLLNVDDPRLEGIEQVTAAHELLHAAYERLSESKRKEVNSHLQEVYGNLKDDQLKSKIDQYKQRDADISNELHSILGSEVATLNPYLETYYAKYFSNRAEIVGFAKKYQTVFDERKTKLKQYDSQLSEIVAQIEPIDTELQRQVKIINDESDRLNNLKKEGNISEYNAGVPAYNALLVPYRTLYTKRERLFTQYETLLAERNKLAAEAQELNDAIDSRIKTAPSQKL